MHAGKGLPIRLRAAAIVVGIAALLWPSVSAARASYRPAATSATPSPTAGSPSPSPTQSAAQSPSPSASPTPSPSASQPAPSPTPSQAAALTVSSATDSPLAELGASVHYTVTVANTGDTTLTNVSAVDRVPLEVDVVSVAINSAVQATELGQHRNSEDVVWEIGPMTPGEVLRLTWTGKVVGVGGFDAVNSVTARSHSTVVSTSSTTYLASTKLVGVSNPPYRSTRTVVTYEAAASTESSAASAAAGTTTAGTAGLPFTGARLGVIFVVGLVLIGVGITIAIAGRSRKTGVAISIVALAALTACVTSSNVPTATPSVKGRRITQAPSPASSPKSQKPPAGKDHSHTPAPQGSHVPPVPSGPVAVGPGPAPVVPSPAPSVRIVHVVPVTAADLPVETAGTTSGSDAMTYAWDAQGGYLTSSTSTRSFDRHDVAITGTLNDSGGAIHIRLAIKNQADDHRVGVRGNLVLSIRGAGVHETLTSPLIDVTLTPSGTAHAAFDYALPSGTYGTSFAFVPRSS